MYSFDVFDTLITRTTAAPQGIFALMRDRLNQERHIHGLEDYVIDNFFELRIHSEELARKAGSFQQIEEVGLRDIYKAMAVCGCINEGQIEYLCRLEQDMEIANVEGMPENIRRLKELLELGERVILISDMYLPKETIQKMLLQADCILGTLPLYVSSEYGRRKTTGNLYRLVQSIEQVNYEDWTHIGDNVFQDIEIPYRLGIKVELVPKTELTDFEKKLLGDYGSDSRLQMMIGTATRIKRGYPQTDAYRIGCSYAGPVLYSYAEWIVNQAVRKGIKRLYFIARDGYLVKKIVDIILDRKKAGIVTSYIYGSRKAWRMCSLSEKHYNLYQLVLWSHIYRITTLDELAAVMHIPLQELYEYLPGTFSKDKEETHISNQELEYIVGRLSEDVSFRDYHLQKLAGERKSARQYLTQEIDVSDDRFAFVDVSGGGLTQGCLLELMKDRCRKPIRTFFFKIDRVNLVEGSITDTFLPGFLENNLTIEMMCRAPHGQTRGYTENNGKIIPELEEAENRLLIEHGYEDYEKGILDFSKLMCEVSVKSGIGISSMKNVLLYLKHIAEEPSEDVLEYFASMPSSESGRGTEAVEYAPRLTKKEIEEIFLIRTNEPIEFFYKGTDLNYSIMRATKEERDLIEHYKKEHNSTLGRLYRQESERRQKELRSRYGRAAFYPVRLLEERIVLYGAGKFGQDLYNRLIKDKKHKIVLWVDKNAAACQQRGLTSVHSVSEIGEAAYDQIVIAVMDQELADVIRGELEQMGVNKESIIWLKPCGYPNPTVEWKSKGIG